MEWLFIIGLGAVIFLLWDRLNKLEARFEERLGALEARLSAPSYRSRPTPEAAPEPASEPDAAHEPEPEPLAETAARAATRMVQPVAKAAATGPVETADVTPDPEPEEAAERSRYSLPRFDFEDIFGRRLPIWAGGIALAAGGIFLVLYAIEQGLLGPTTRVSLSLIFGFALLGAAEAAFRFEERVRDPRVRQALAGAGIATLYAAGYLAGAQYGLIGPGVAFGGLALVTLGALALTQRFGLPTAVLGLVGGFATPVMVASEEANVPVLAFYLALLTSGLALTARRLGKRWLGAAGLAGGFAWGLLMLASGPANEGDWIAIGLYLLALGAAVPLLLGESNRLPFMRLASGAMAAVQMGALVALAGFDLLNWGLYGLLAAALAVLAWRNDELRPAGLLVTTVAAVLLGVWGEPATGNFVLVAAGLAIVLLGAPLAMVWRAQGGLIALVQASLGALAFGAASYAQFASYDNTVFLPGLGAGLGAFALVSAAAAWLAWRDGELGKLVALPVAASALLGFGATHVLLDDWAEVLGAVSVTLVLAALAWRRGHGFALTALVWVGGLVTLVALLSTGDMLDELALAFGLDEGEVDLGRALLRWGAATLPFAALAWLETNRRLRQVAEALLLLVVYVFLAQFIPAPALAWTLGLSAAALAYRLHNRSGLWGAALVLGVLWALAPVFEWLAAGTPALFGEPMLAGDLPGWQESLRRVAPLAFASGVAAWRREVGSRLGTVLTILAASALAITVHVLFKQVFALGDFREFAALGMAERTLWQGLLVAGGIALMRFAPRDSFKLFGTALTALGLAHFAWFTAVLHNPLWSEQVVGPLPLANLLAPAYLIAGLAVWTLSRRAGEASVAGARQAGDALLMVLIALWALSELRHGFAGSVLIRAPMTQSEDLLRSFVGIVLALGFLWWGSIKGQRSWRIGSLVLMLVAVLKVFLFDAAGLEGLLRVASFVALGASLIAIGWVYSRQLSRRGDAALA